MTEMNAAEMKNHRPVALTRTPQSLPPHIPREMPAIYQILEGIEEGIKLLKKAVYRRLGKETLE